MELWTEKTGGDNYRVWSERGPRAESSGSEWASFLFCGKTRGETQTVRAEGKTEAADCLGTTGRKVLSGLGGVFLLSSLRRDFVITLDPDQYNQYNQYNR